MADQLILIPHQALPWPFAGRHKTGDCYNQEGNDPITTESAKRYFQAMGKKLLSLVQRAVAWVCYPEPESADDEDLVDQR